MKNKTLAGTAREAVIGEKGRVVRLPTETQPGTVRFTIPLLGFIAFNKFLSEDDEDYETDNKVKDIKTQKVSHVVVKSKKLRSLNLAFYIVGGLSLIFALIPSLFFDFVGGQDANLAKNGWPIDALQADRAGLLSADAWRSFTFITLTFGVMWMFLKSKISSKYVIYSFIDFSIIIIFITITII